MAELQRVPVVSLGKLGDLQAVNSRVPAGFGGKAAEVATAGVQAQADITGSTLGEAQQTTGAALVQQGVDLLKPLEKLAQTRELIQAQGIAADAKLQMRAQVAALKSGGTPYLGWVKESTTAFDQIYKTADATAAKINPAVREAVTRELQTERLRLTGEVQSDVLTHDANDQLNRIASVHRQFETDFFNLPPGQARRDALLGITQLYQGAAATGLMSATVAGEKIRSLGRFIVENDAVQTAPLNLPLSLEKIAQGKDVMTPDEQLIAVDKVLSAAGVSDRVAAIGGKQREKAIKLEQDKLAEKLYLQATDPNIPLTDLTALVGGAVQGMGGTAGLRDEQVRGLTKVLREREAALLKKEPQVDDHERVAKWTRVLRDTPELVDVDDLMADGLVANAKAGLVQQYYSNLDVKHWRKNQNFKGLLAEIDGVEPPNSIINVVGKVTAGTLRPEIEVAKNRLDQLMQARSKELNSVVLDDNDILRIGQAYTVEAVKSLREKKLAPTIGPSWDSLRGTK